MEISYTYWEADDGWFVGFLNAYPDHLTQGHDIAEVAKAIIKFFPNIMIFVPYDVLHD